MRRDVLHTAHLWTTTVDTRLQLAQSIRRRRRSVCEMELLVAHAPSNEGWGLSGLGTSMVRAVSVVSFLYLFLVGVSMLEAGINSFGAGFQADLLDGVDHPLAGLAAGILATVLVQSSSVSTATIVGLVGAGTLTVDAAVPMIMGANIGTTVTTTLVALGSSGRSDEFRRAFAGATVHDFFNLLAVAAFLPLQVATDFLSRAAEKVAELLGGNVGGSTTKSPIKRLVKEPVGWIEDGIDSVAASDALLGGFLVTFGILLIFIALALITRNMRRLIASRIEAALNSVVSRGGGLVGMAFGGVITLLVQSSSITTSILVPLVGSGVLTVRNAYPITLGANLGTTITALLASLAVDLQAGLVVALTHTLFNLAAIVLIYPVHLVRYVPVQLAEGMAEFATVHRAVVILYVVGVFVVAPLLGILLFG